MGIYGNLVLENNSDNTYKLFGISGNIMDNELTKKYIKEDLSIIKKSWNKFLDEVSEKYMDYINDCKNNGVDVSRFKSKKDILKDIKLKQWEYRVDLLKSDRILRAFYPFIDFTHPIDDHVPSIEAHVEDTGLILDRIYFDG